MLVERAIAVTAWLAMLSLAPSLAVADGDRETTPLAAPSALPPSHLALTLRGPAELDVDDSRGPPAGYTEVHRRRTGLLINGVIMCATSYGFSAFLAADGQNPQNGRSYTPMWIPILGPFLELGQASGSCEGVCTGENVLLFTLGAAQIAGAVMTYFGATSAKRVWVRNDYLHDVVVGPMAGPNGATGLSLSGRW